MQRSVNCASIFNFPALRYHRVLFLNSGKYEYDRAGVELGLVSRTHFSLTERRILITSMMEVHILNLFQFFMGLLFAGIVGLFFEEKKRVKQQGQRNMEDNLLLCTDSYKVMIVIIK